MSGRFPRRIVFMVVGFILSLGCPLGWWVMRAYFGDQISDLHMYVYLIIAAGGAFTVFGYSVGLLYDRLQEMVDQDALTGLLNGAGFHKACRSVFALACRSHEPMAVMSIDIDDFKAVNDRYGHAAGDFVLLEISSILKGTLRKSDVAARLGGDEFIVCLPRVEMANSKIAAERVRQKIANRHFAFDGQVIPVTVSIGIHAVIADAHVTWESLLKASDDALRVAKSNGRNTVRPE